MRRRFTEERHARNEQMEKTRPSVFTLLPSKGFKEVENWAESVTKGEELGLTLYCEHDSGWHTTSHSVYRFTPDQNWFDLLKGSWNQLAGITKYVGPLAKAFGKVTLSHLTEAAGLVIDKLPEIPRAATAALSRPFAPNSKPEFLDLHTPHLLQHL